MLSSPSHTTRTSSRPLLPHYTIAFVAALLLFSVVWIIAMLVTIPADLRDTTSQYREDVQAQPCTSADTTLAASCTQLLRQKAADRADGTLGFDVVVWLFAFGILGYIGAIFAVEWSAQRIRIRSVSP